MLKYVKVPLSTLEVNPVFNKAWEQLEIRERMDPYKRDLQEQEEQDLLEEMKDTLQLNQQSPHEDLSAIVFG